MCAGRAIGPASLSPFLEDENWGRGLWPGIPWCLARVEPARLGQGDSNGLKPTHHHPRQEAGGLPVAALSLGTTARLSRQAWGRLLPGSPEGLAQCVQCQSGWGRGCRRRARLGLPSGLRAQQALGRERRAQCGQARLCPHVFRGGLRRTCDPL